MRCHRQNVLRSSVFDSIHEPVGATVGRAPRESCWHINAVHWSGAESSRVESSQFGTASIIIKDKPWTAESHEFHGDTHRWPVRVNAEEVCNNFIVTRQPNGCSLVCTSWRLLISVIIKLKNGEKVWSLPAGYKKKQHRFYHKNNRSDSNYSQKAEDQSQSTAKSEQTNVPHNLCLTSGLTSNNVMEPRNPPG